MSDLVVVTTWVVMRFCPRPSGDVRIVVLGLASAVRSFREAFCFRL
jgi:hypothetical protein